MSPTSLYTSDSDDPMIRKSRRILNEKPTKRADTLHESRRTREPSSRFRRARERVHLSASPSTLIDRLITEEHESSKTRALLEATLAELHASAPRPASPDQRALDAARTLAQRASDAQNAAAAAAQELAEYKLRLAQAQREIERSKKALVEVATQRDEAEQAAADARTLARRLHEERLVATATHQGHREGFDEGLRQGRMLALAAAREEQATIAHRPMKRITGANQEGSSSYRGSKPASSRRSSLPAGTSSMPQAREAGSAREDYKRPDLQTRGSGSRSHAPQPEVRLASATHPEVSAPTIRRRAASIASNSARSEQALRNDYVSDRSRDSITLHGPRHPDLVFPPPAGLRLDEQADIREQSALPSRTASSVTSASDREEQYAPRAPTLSTTPLAAPPLRRRAASITSSEARAHNYWPTIRTDDSGYTESITLAPSSATQSTFFPTTAPRNDAERRDAPSNIDRPQRVSQLTSFPQSSYSAAPDIATTTFDLPFQTTPAAPPIAHFPMPPPPIVSTTVPAPAPPPVAPLFYGRSQGTPVASTPALSSHRRHASSPESLTSSISQLDLVNLPVTSGSRNTRPAERERERARPLSVIPEEASTARRRSAKAGAHQAEALRQWAQERLVDRNVQLRPGDLRYLSPAELEAWRQGANPSAATQNIVPSRVTPSGSSYERSTAARELNPFRANSSDPPDERAPSWAYSGSRADDSSSESIGITIHPPSPPSAAPPISVTPLAPPEESLLSPHGPPLPIPPPKNQPPYGSTSSHRAPSGYTYTAASTSALTPVIPPTYTDEPVTRSIYAGTPQPAWARPASSASSASRAARTPVIPRMTYEPAPVSPGFTYPAPPGAAPAPTNASAARVRTESMHAGITPSAFSRALPAVAAIDSVSSHASDSDDSLADHATLLNTRANAGSRIAGRAFSYS